jgi:hypothetical protein
VVKKWLGDEDFRKAIFDPVLTTLTNARGKLGNKTLWHAGAKGLSSVDSEPDSSPSSPPSSPPPASANNLIQNLTKISKNLKREPVPGPAGSKPSGKRPSSGFKRVLSFGREKKERELLADPAYIACKKILGAVLDYAYERYNL